MKLLDSLLFSFSWCPSKKWYKLKTDNKKFHRISDKMKKEKIVSTFLPIELNYNSSIVYRITINNDYSIFDWFLFG